MKKGIILDLDGTMWDSTGTVIPAWNNILRKYNFGREMTRDEMSGYMGKTLGQIAEIMFPTMKPNESLDILLDCCSEEQKYLRKSGGKLYDNLEITLQRLKSNYSL